MNGSIFKFENLCSELTNDEKQAADMYLNNFCPSGESQYYRNYFFRLYWLASRSNAKK